MPLVSRKDDGAVAVVTAVVLAFLSLAMLGLVIDVAQAFEERRQLQNGADAAAMAVAAAYLDSGGSLTPSEARNIARDLATRNARDGAGAVYGIYGRDAGDPLFDGAVGPTLSPGYDPPVADYPSYVEVRTETETAEGGSVLPFLFSGEQGAVTAVGRASWGPVGRLRGLPVTMSICEWAAATSDGTLYAAPPPYPPDPDASLEATVHLQDSSGTGCDRGPANQFVPGGFGWLEGGDDCEVTTDADGVAPGATGSSQLPDCRDVLDQMIHDREVVFVPVHDAVTEDGGYHISGYAAFVITGYALPGLDTPSWLTGRGSKDCAAPAGTEPPAAGGGGGGGNTQGQCLFGLFTEALAPSADGAGGVEFGATAVQLVR